MSLPARSARELRKLDVRCNRDAAHHLVLRARLQGVLRIASLVATDVAAVAVAVASAKLVLALQQGGLPALPDATFPYLGYILVLSLAATGAYHSRGFRRDPARVVGAGVLAALGGQAVPVLTGRPEFGPALVTLAVSALLVVVGCRVLVERVVAQVYARGRLRSRVVLVADGGHLAMAQMELSRLHVGAVEVVEALRVREDREGRGAAVAELDAVLGDRPVDQVVVAGMLSTASLREVVQTSLRRGVRVQLLPALDREDCRWIPRWVGDCPLVEVRPRRVGIPQMAMKRALDIAVAGSAMLLLSPLLSLIAAAIKLDSAGPVLFGQTRVGVGGECFRMWKFRTMVADADRMKMAMAAMNESGDPRLFKVSRDPRVTRVGRWLRAASLDELPQLINVLRGEMSLVGPRPFFPDDLELYEPHHFERLAVLPGITGLWQISGRSDIKDFDAVVELDLEYIRRWSVGLDLSILLRTIPVVFRREGAY